MGYTFDHTREVPVIRDFAAAQAHWDRQKAWPNGKKPLGARRFNNRSMAMYHDGSIGLRYFDDEVIVYHPDGTVTAMAPQQQRQGGTIERIMPLGIYGSEGQRSGPVLFLVPIKRAREDASRSGYLHFWGVTRTEDKNGKPVRNPNILVVRGDRPVHLHVVKDRWEPTDMGVLSPFRWLAPERKIAMAASQEAGVPDLVSALNAYIGLGVELPDFKHMSDRDLMAALRARDFRTVMAGIERNFTYPRDSYGQRTGLAVVRAAPSAINRLRDMAIKEAGALVTREAQILPFPEYVKLEALARRFGKP